MGKKQKVKVPDSVLELRLSLKKFAKKNNISMKGLGKKRKKEVEKKLLKSYSAMAIKNLNKAVKILSENPDVESKKLIKLKDGVDNIIVNGEVMKKIASIYKKDPDEYPNLIYLPYMITNTILYLNRDDLSEEEKALAEKIDKEALLEFCEKILKKQIKHYKDYGLDDSVAFELANTIPTTKLLQSNRRWYSNLLRKLNILAADQSIDLITVIESVRKVDRKKKDRISKKDFLAGFFAEVMMTKASNKSATHTDTQKELQDNLIEATLEYLESLSEKKLREALKRYIKRRKNAEEHKNDTRRIIRFVDHANSNSKYTNLRTVVQELIAENSNNELYLS